MSNSASCGRSGRRFECARARDGASCVAGGRAHLHQAAHSELNLGLNCRNCDLCRAERAELRWEGFE